MRLKGSIKKQTRSVTLTFCIPEDQDELHLALRGSEYLSALQEFADVLRSGVKYKDKEWEEIADLFYGVLQTYNINVHEEVQ